MSNETNEAAQSSATVLDSRAAALELMESALRDGRPMAAEYPLVFNEGAPGHLSLIHI